jgi:cell division protein FtsB
MTLPTATNLPDDSPDAAQPRARVRRRVSKGPEARERKKRRWTYGLMAMSTVLMVNALMGEKGYLANMQARQEYQKVSESLRRLNIDNDDLIDEARRLRSNPLALEDEARRQLGLIKPGETIITVRDRPLAHR